MAERVGRSDPLRERPMRERDAMREGFRTGRGVRVSHPSPGVTVTSYQGPTGGADAAEEMQNDLASF